MGPQVSGQVGGLGECLGADVATVRLFTTVRPQVGLEGGWTGIGLATDVADVAAFAGAFSLGTAWGLVRLTVFADPF